MPPASQLLRGKGKHREGEEILQEKLEQHIARHKEDVARLNATSSASLQKLTEQLAAKETQIKSLRAKSIASAITRVGTNSQPKPSEKKLAGGTSRVTKKRLAERPPSFFRQEMREDSSTSNPTFPL